MQSVYSRNGTRFKTKKSLKEAAASKSYIGLEATSLFGNEYDGDVQDAPDGTYTVVGPSPTVRVWYANIIKSQGKVVVK